MEEKRGINYMKKLILTDCFGNEKDIYENPNQFVDDGTIRFEDTITIEAEDENGVKTDPITIRLSPKQVLEEVLPNLHYYVENAAFPTDEELETYIEMHPEFIWTD